MPEAVARVGSSSSAVGSQDLALGKGEKRREEGIHNGEVQRERGRERNGVAGRRAEERKKERMMGGSQTR
jgi:hypothetical protein